MVDNNLLVPVNRRFFVLPTASSDYSGSLQWRLKHWFTVLEATVLRFCIDFDNVRHHLVVCLI